MQDFFFLSAGYLREIQRVFQRDTSSENARFFFF